MGKRILFNSTESFDEHIEVFATKDAEVIIIIEGNGCQSICLDKETAIEFFNELKTQIGYLDIIEEEKN